ncbi:hypothetical protein [Streptomyces qinglanensis]|uniref:hypothetical protein n=1 Tax=Streptomyces qinglanensis TaxID=943816 RepID=UPI0037BD2BE8
MTQHTTTAARSAQDLADEIGRLRRTAPVGNALLETAERGELTDEHLRRLIGTEAQCHTAELAAYGTMLARFPHRPAADLYLRLGRLVHDAEPKLESCARAFSLTPDQLVRWPSERAAYAFDGALSYAALHGGQAAGALAMYADMQVYFSGCSRLVAHLRAEGTKVPEEFLAYYEDDPDDELCRLALDVVQDGLERGDDPEEAVFHARLVEEGIGDFWRAAAAA